MINIKLLTEESYAFMKNNIEFITKKIQENDSNEWIYDEFPNPIFIEKSLKIEDFDLENNPNSIDKIIDFNNSILLYERLNGLPRYILCDDKFWLWLYFDKFYEITKNMMKVKTSSTIKDHWMYCNGVRRGNFFGVLSRCYYRVMMTIDESNNDKYELTKWIIENPERIRNLTWRTFSSELHLVRGCLKGQKKALQEVGKEKNIYPEIAKFISILGSVKLLDVLPEEYIEDQVYKKAKELFLK